MSGKVIHHSGKALANPDGLEIHETALVTMRRTDGGGWFMDFGRAAFGTLRLTANADFACKPPVLARVRLDGLLPPGTSGNEVRRAFQPQPAGRHEFRVNSSIGQ